MNGIEGVEWGTQGCISVTKHSAIQLPSSMYVFIEEADPRTFNRGTWVLNIVADNWVDPMAIYHNNASSLGYSGWTRRRSSLDRKGTIDAARKAAVSGTLPFQLAQGGTRTTGLQFMKRGYCWVSYPKYLKVGPGSRLEVAEGRPGTLARHVRVASFPFLVAVALPTGAGCQSMYYATMEDLAWRRGFVEEGRGQRRDSRKRRQRSSRMP